MENFLFRRRKCEKDGGQRPSGAAVNGGTILAALPMDECLSVGGGAAFQHQPAAVSTFLFTSRP